jgi:putative spermidine/putrescine transport system permease protein
MWGERRQRLWDMLVIGLVMLYILLPLFVLVEYALAEKWYAYKLFPEKLGFKWFSWVLRHTDTRGAIFNSYTLAPLVMLSTLALTIPAGYVLGTRRTKLSLLTENIVNMNMALPAIVIGVGLMPFYIRLGLMYNYWALIPAHMIGAIPYTLRYITAAFVQVPRELEEAARTLGATRSQVIRKVYLPLTWRGILAGGVFALSWSLNEFILTLLLGSPKVKTIPVAIYEYVGGYYLTPQPAAALSILIIIPSILIALLLEKYVQVSLGVGG